MDSSLKLKKRLYPVVLDLFSEKDFHQVTLREICRRSGISPSTIYQYFPSKETMLFTILDERISEIGVLVREHIKGLASVQECFRKIFWVTMDFYDQNPGVAITAFITLPMRSWMREPAYVRDEASGVVKELTARGHERGELDPDVSYSQIMDLYYMFCYRQIHLWYYRGRKGNLTDAIPGFFKLFWKTVSKP